MMLGVAALVSTYLAVQSQRAGGIPGCDAGGCAVVLGSKWSKALGAPVGLFGTAAYLLLAILGSRPFLPTQRGLRTLATALALLIPGAAAWFVALQIWVLKAFCPWCCATHSIATLGAVFMAAAWRRDSLPPSTAATSAKPANSRTPTPAPSPSPASARAPRVWPAAAALAAATLAGMITVQSLGPEPAPPKALRVAMEPAATSTPTQALLPRDAGTTNSGETAPSPSATTTPTTTTPPGKRLIPLHDGKFKLDPQDLPLFGSPEATHLVVMISDYTCKFCRATHKMLGDIHEAFDDQELGFVMLPSHHGGDSEQIQMLMLATWRTDPAVWRRVADDLYSERIPLKPEAVRTVLEQQLGTGRLDPALSAHRSWTTNLFALARGVHAANKAKAGSGNIPQMIIGHEIIVGAPDGSGEIFAVLEKNLGLARKRLPELRLATEVVDLGRVFAGTTRTFALVYTNLGQATLQLTRARLPPGGRVGQGMMNPIAPGKNGTVELTFGVPREEGAFDVAITLHSNARVPSTELRVKGVAWKPLRITPEILDFGRLDADQSATQAVMRVELLEPVRIESVRSQNPGYSVSVNEVEPMKIYDLTVATTAALGAGRQQGVLRLTFAKPVPPGWPETIALAARAEVDRAVTVTPPRLTLPAGTLTSDRHHQVLVRCLDGMPDFSVSGAVLEGGPAFTMPEIQKSTGTDHIVVVRLPSGWTPPTPPSGARLVIHTNHRRYPILEVPLVPQP